MKKLDYDNIYPDEVWHSTGPTPRRFPGDHTYVCGLDVLGAVTAASATRLPAARTATAAAAPAVTAAAAAPRLQPIAKTAATPPPVAVQPSAVTRRPPPVEVKPSAVTLRTQTQGSEVKPSAVALYAQKGEARSASAVQSKAAVSSKAAALANAAKKNASGAAAIAAANKAMAAGRKLAKYRPQAGGKLVAKAQKFVKKAQTTVKGSVFGLTQQELLVQNSGGPPSDSGGGGGDSSSGDIFMNTAYLAAAGTYSQLARATDAVADLILPVLDQVKASGMTESARRGENIYNRLNDLIEQFNQTDENTNFNATAAIGSAALRVANDASAWANEVHSASGPAATDPLAPGFDPGTAGGGGGGSDDEEGYASEGGSGETGDPRFDEAEEDVDPRFDEGAAQEGYAPNFDEGGDAGGGMEEGASFDYLDEMSDEPLEEEFLDDFEEEILDQEPLDEEFLDEEPLEEELLDEELLGADKKSGGGANLTGGAYDAMWASIAKDAAGIAAAGEGKKTEKRNLASDIINPLNLITAAIEAGGSPDEALARYGLGGMTQAQHEAIRQAADTAYIQQLQEQQKIANAPKIEVDPTTLRRLMLAKKKYDKAMARKLDLDARKAAELAHAESETVMGAAYARGLDILGGWS